MCSCDSLQDDFYAIITDTSIDSGKVCIGSDCKKPEIKDKEIRRAVIR